MLKMTATVREDQGTPKAESPKELRQPKHIYGDLAGGDWKAQRERGLLDPIVERIKQLCVPGTEGEIWT